jgi:putative peptide zinc metalloprotease protein
MKQDTTPASDLERRKKVRLRIRQDLAIAPQKYEGRTYYVVKDPVSLRYYRFKEQEHFLIRLMDGKHTLDDAQKSFEKRFRPDRLTLEDLESFGQQLLNAGLAQNESPQAGKQLFDRRKKRRRSQLVQALTNILYIKIPVYDPDKLLNQMLRYTRWIFTTWFLLATLALMGAAVWLVLTHFETVRDRLPYFQEFFTFKRLMFMWLALGIVKVIHEFGHGLSCKAFGGEVHEMGLLFLCLSPCLYCNVSDAWTLPNKWKRIIISGAGIYVELIIAAISTFIWWNSPNQQFLNNLTLSLMVVCSVSTVFFNANPLMRYDGYYVLADWLEIPNLRERSNRYMSRLVMDHCLGIEVQPEPYMERWRRVLFVTYAVGSYIYRWVVTFVILRFMYFFLKPYGLQIISELLTMLAAGSMVGWPLYRLGKNIHKRGRLPDMKPVRVTISASVVLTIIALFFFLPLPMFSKIKETGLVQIQPNDIVPVHVELSGVLEKIKVQEGQEVKKGEILALFRNPEMELEEETYHAKYLIAQKKVEYYTGQSKDAPDLQKYLKVAEGERDVYKKQWEYYRTHPFKRMELKAPRAGTVMGLPEVEKVNRYWEAEKQEPFCKIAKLNKIRIQVPVSTTDIDLIRADLKKLKQEGKAGVGVTVRIAGRGNHTWEGVIERVPDEEARQIPPQLSDRAGGPVTLKRGIPPDQPQYQPLKQVYLVDVKIINPDQAIRPGTFGQVRIHCRPRTCWWMCWRWISSTFGLGF